MQTLLEVLGLVMIANIIVAVLYIFVFAYLEHKRRLNYIKSFDVHEALCVCDECRALKANREKIQKSLSETNTGNVNLPSNAEVGCGASVGGFLEQDADVVAGFRPYRNKTIFCGPSARKCLEPGCKPIVNPGECFDNILFRKFERFSNE